LVETPKVDAKQGQDENGQDDFGSRSFTRATSVRARGRRRPEWPALRKEAKVKIAPSQAATAKIGNPSPTRVKNHFF